MDINTILALMKKRRFEYGKIWDMVSETENDARFAISGGTDEDDFITSGTITRGVLEQTVGLKPDDEILEIGCGIGRVGHALIPNCHSWLGTDVSQNMLVHAARRLMDHPNVGLLLINGFGIIPVKRESLDLIYATVVFMHLDEWDRYSYAEEAYRILRPGGRIYIDNFDLCSDEGWRIFESLRVMDPKDRFPHISRSSTRLELETYLGRAGFQSIQYVQDDGMIRVWGRK